MTGGLAAPLHFHICGCFNRTLTILNQQDVNPLPSLNPSYCFNDPKPHNYAKTYDNHEYGILLFPNMAILLISPWLT